MSYIHTVCTLGDKFCVSESQPKKDAGAKQQLENLHNTATDSHPRETRAGGLTCQRYI